MIMILTKNQVVHHDAGDKLFGYDTSSSCWQVPIFRLFHTHCVFFYLFYLCLFFILISDLLHLAGRSPYSPFHATLSFFTLIKYLLSCIIYSCWQVPHCWSFFLSLPLAGDIQDTNKRRVPKKSRQNLYIKNYSTKNTCQRR